MKRSEHVLDEVLASELAVVRMLRERGEHVRAFDVREEDDRGRVRWHCRIEWTRDHPAPDHGGNPCSTRHERT